MCSIPSWTSPPTGASPSCAPNGCCSGSLAPTPSGTATRSGPDASSARSTTPGGRGWWTVDACTTSRPGAAGKGNSGIVILRELLESRPPDHRPTDSNLERRWEEVVGDLAGQFRRQVVLGDDAPIGRFDQVHRHRPLVVEIHSEKFHTMPSDIADDARRAEQLVEAGFCVVVYWEYDIWHDARTVRDSLRTILAKPERPGLHRPTPAPYDLLPQLRRS